MDVWYYRISVACDIMKWHKGDVKTIWIHYPVTYASVVPSTLHLAFPGDVTDICTNIQEEEEEEDDTPHGDTWPNARVWVDFLGGLH
jgi:hypothetical protein